MCHDISFSATTVEFINDLLPGIIWDHQISIDFNTTDHILSMSNRPCIILYKRDNAIHAMEAEWGLIANFMNTPELVKQWRTNMANARDDKVLSKKSVWNKLINKNRCLVVFDSFIEHREVKGIKNKIPYVITPAHFKYWLIPGFYNYSPIPDKETGEIKPTFALITRPANEVMKKIHNHGPNKHKMPLMMSHEQALEWLEKDFSDEELEQFLAYEIPSEDICYYTTWTVRTTKPRPDEKGKLDPYEWPNLPPLGIDEIQINTLF